MSVIMYVSSKECWFIINVRDMYQTMFNILNTYVKDMQKIMCN